MLHYSKAVNSACDQIDRGTIVDTAFDGFVLETASIIQNSNLNNFIFDENGFFIDLISFITAKPLLAHWPCL